jgi:NADH dehydrogenase
MTLEDTLHRGSVDRMAAGATPKLVTVFGGSGFLGRHVVRALAKRGYMVRAAVRRPDLAGHLQPLGNVGQIHAVQANLRVRWSVDRAMEGASHAVNCVSAPFSLSPQKMTAIQDFGARAIAEAARGAGAGLTHISAIGADADSETVYASTKARGEKAVFETIAGAVVLRPSILFGPEDQFYNMFAAIARISPVLPLFGGGQSRFQPVYVGDVAEAVARSVDGTLQGGTVYELGGPDVKSFRDIMQEVLDATGRKRILLAIPWPIARLQGAVLGILPKPLLTSEQVKLLALDNVVSDQAIRDGRTLQGIGIVPQGTDAILPTYLWQYRATGQFWRGSLA